VNNQRKSVYLTRIIPYLRSLAETLKRISHSAYLRTGNEITVQKTELMPGWTQQWETTS